MLRDPQNGQVPRISIVLMVAAPPRLPLLLGFAVFTLPDPHPDDFRSPNYRKKPYGSDFNFTARAIRLAFNRAA